MKWTKKNTVNLFLVILILLGIGLLLYPSVSDYWNKLHQSRAITAYSDTVSQMDTSEMDELIEKAEKYNSELAAKPLNLNLTPIEIEKYNSLLTITNSGAMSYIEIDKINCYLPIYHGTDEGVLSVAVGHIAGTSLPVGGESTHCVLSGHRGLPSAKLFTNLDKLVEGDTFVIRTMNEILTYEVDQIRIVLPHEVDDLEIVEGEDLLTLVTCTPYGVNSHRLLVRGHRIENLAQAAKITVTADAIQIESTIVAPIMAVPLLLIVIFIMLMPKKSNHKSGGDSGNENS